ncbi:prepilin-type N-terminal cleavage/methylation domain-containing protein [Burkholderiales bacterium JOSHI_001]|nr:prepilin-type N-terminal cleavage/methylation domain-containing protein [Burkholderiales bacterium JOSHI_001]
MRGLPALRDRGFTMVESLVVLAVLGVVLAMAAPSVGEMMERQHVRGIADGLSTDLRLARTEAIRRGGSANDVLVNFGSNNLMTCYAITTVIGGGGANCDCTRNPGGVCLPAGVRQEIKTVQVRRATGVIMAASSPSTDMLSFQPPMGLLAPANARIDITSDHGLALRLLPNAAGAVQRCSPGGTVSGVPAC